MTAREETPSYRQGREASGYRAASDALSGRCVFTEIRPGCGSDFVLGAGYGRGSPSANQNHLRGSDMAGKTPIAKNAKKPAKQTLKEKRAAKREKSETTASFVKPRKRANS